LLPIYLFKALTVGFGELRCHHRWRLCNGGERREAH